MFASMIKYAADVKIDDIFRTKINIDGSRLHFRKTHRSVLRFASVIMTSMVANILSLSDLSLLCVLWNKTSRQSRAFITRVGHVFFMYKYRAHLTHWNFNSSFVKSNFNCDATLLVFPSEIEVT